MILNINLEVNDLKYIDDMLLPSDSYTVEETENGLTFTKADDKTAAPTTPTDAQKPASNKTNKV